jgi:hypothetical protein
MTDGVPGKDLIVLVADGQMEHAVRGLLTHNEAIGFQRLSFDAYVHPNKDPGCLLRGHDFLRPFNRQYRHAMVMLDREGCGRYDVSRNQLEMELEARLSTAGWDNRAVAVILDPELEIWVWSDSPVVEEVLGWSNRTPRLAEWLQSEGHVTSGQTKPSRPKEAMEHALRLARRSRSSAIFLKLAQRVSVKRCIDPAFLKFKSVLRKWFPGANEAEDI